jgi:hypothetical protein
MMRNRGTQKEEEREGENQRGEFMARWALMGLQLQSLQSKLIIFIV